MHSEFLRSPLCVLYVLLILIYSGPIGVMEE